MNARYTRTPVGRARAMAFVNKRAIGSDLMQVLEEFAATRRTEDPHEGI